MLRLCCLLALVAWVSLAAPTPNEQGVACTNLFRTLTFTHQVRLVSGNVYTIALAPSATAPLIDWANVHYSVGGGDLVNVGLVKQANVWAMPALNTATVLPGQQMTYFFTLCSSTVDCDTDLFAFTAPSIPAPSPTSGLSCPLMDFSQQVLAVGPAGANLYKIQFTANLASLSANTALTTVEVHYSVLSGPYQNFQMRESTTGSGVFENTGTVGSSGILLASGGNMRYYFTYYVQGTACDTNSYTFSPPSTGPNRPSPPPLPSSLPPRAQPLPADTPSECPILTFSQQVLRVSAGLYKIRFLPVVPSGRTLSWVDVHFSTNAALAPGGDPAQFNFRMDLLPDVTTTTTTTTTAAARTPPVIYEEQGPPAVGGIVLQNTDTLSYFFTYAVDQVADCDTMVYQFSPSLPGPSPPGAGGSGGGGPLPGPGPAPSNPSPTVLGLTCPVTTFTASVVPVDTTSGLWQVLFTADPPQSLPVALRSVDWVDVHLRLNAAAQPDNFRMVPVTRGGRGSSSSNNNNNNSSSSSSSGGGPPGSLPGGSAQLAFVSTGRTDSPGLSLSAGDVLHYSFTYCILATDCDTPEQTFTVPSTPTVSPSNRNTTGVGRSPRDGPLPAPTTAPSPSPSPSPASPPPSPLPSRNPPNNTAGGSGGSGGRGPLPSPSPPSSPSPAPSPARSVDPLRAPPVTTTGPTPTSGVSAAVGSADAVCPVFQFGWALVLLQGEQPASTRSSLFAINFMPDVSTAHIVRPVAWVDVHIGINGAPLDNYRLTEIDEANWISMGPSDGGYPLRVGDTIGFFFTYCVGQPQEGQTDCDSEWFSVTL